MNNSNYVKAKIPAVYWDGPRQGEQLFITCLFDTREQADLVKLKGRFRISTVLKAQGQPYGLFFQTYGSDKAGSVLPLIGIMAKTHRKPGYHPADFRSVAFKNVEKRLVSEQPIQTSIPFSKPVITKPKTKKQAIITPVSITKTNLEQTIGLHVTKMPVAIPAIHVVINNCKVSGTAEDVAKLLKQM